MRRETQGPFLFATVILGFLLIFNKSQSLSHCEALNSGCLSWCQRDERPPVQIRWGPRSFSSVSTADSGIPLSCEMKDEPPFKRMRGNSGFLQVRSSWCPFYLRLQSQGPFPIIIAEGSLLLRCLWKVGLPLQVKPGNQLSSGDDLQCTELSSRCCDEISVPLDLRRVSQGISGVA